MSADPLSPFGRASNAPLAGRTILQLVPPHAAGGDEGSTLAIAAALVEAGARALVAGESSELASDVQAIGGLHLPFPAASRNPFAMALNARRLARLLESERVDLVHARARAVAWVALGACRKLKLPLVTAISGEGAARRPRSSFEGAPGEGDFVVVASQFAAERAAEAFPAALPHLRIVRPGLDLVRFAPDSVSRQRVTKAREAWGVEPHQRVVLASGRLAPARGARLIIEAAALLMQKGLSDVRFVLAGEAAKISFARELDALADARGIKAAVARVGALSDPVAAFVGASVAVFAAGEPPGLGRAIMEAAATGALVVATDVGAAREIVLAPPYAPPEERTGWTVPPGDAAALAAAIEIGADGRRVSAGGDEPPGARPDRRPPLARAHEARHAERLRRGARTVSAACGKVTRAEPLARALLAR